MRRRIPPPRFCPHCGAPTGRGWSASACDRCRKLAADKPESLRDYRKRVLDPERNAR
jgi:hypothetical protein